MAQGEIQGFESAGFVLRRRSEEQIGIRGDAGPVERLQRLGGRVHAGPFVQGVQYALIPRFQPQFEHAAAGFF